MGTPEFAVGTLKSLVDGGYQVVAVVTQPDKPVGRHQDRLQPSAVKQYALQQGIPVLQPVKMKDPAFVEELRNYKADLQVVVAFRMLPEVVWAMPRFGTFNVHAALLPQYRGAAPINWAIINGETTTGVTTFFLDKNIDTGKIILQASFEIKDDYNVEDVYNGLMELGASMALKTIDLIVEHNGDVPAIDQATLSQPATELHSAPKIFKETCQINWQQGCKQIYDFVRGLSPYPGAWTTLCAANGSETVVKIYKTAKTNLPSTATVGTIEAAKGHLYVATTTCQLELIELQVAGKKRMAAKDFLNGFRGIESMILR